MCPESADEKDRYIRISPLLIRPWTGAKFALYLKQEENYVLYTNKDESFTPSHRDKLADMGVVYVYIPEKQRRHLETYIRENLADILKDDSIPLDERCSVWHKTTLSFMKDVFKDMLPEPLFRSKFNQFEKIVQASLDFFRTPDSLKNLIDLISKGFSDYNHAVGTMVLSAFILMRTGHEENLVRNCAIGALLHDTGKSTLPKKILEKDPSKLSGEEWDLYKTHPNLSVGMCVNLPLSVESFHCILFHHEKENGTGYPSGIQKQSIPSYVKAMILCNEYDILLRATPTRPGYTPYEALQKLENRKKEFDAEMLKNLIMLLADAEVVDR